GGSSRRRRFGRPPAWGRGHQDTLGPVPSCVFTTTSRGGNTAMSGNGSRRRSVVASLASRSPLLVGSPVDRGNVRGSNAAERCSAQIERFGDETRQTAARGGHDELLSDVERVLTAPR